MVLTQAGVCDFSWKAKDFRLKGVDGKTYGLADVSGPKGLLVMFICNHCPYVKAIQDRMVRVAKEKGYPFLYLYDDTQVVARAYNAVCTPDFFGFAKDLGLQYRGRLDASKREAGPPDARRDLHEAMLGVARTDKGPAEQIPSMGCSIEWLDAA